MVKHIVMFRFKGNPGQRLETANKFRNSLVELPGIIPQLISIEVGINQNPAETFDLVLTACAADPDDVAAYSAHPAHQNAVAQIKDRIEQRACVDYTA